MLAFFYRVKCRARSLLMDSEFSVTHGGERRYCSRNKNCHHRQHVGFSRGRSHLWAAAKMSRETLLAKSAYFYQGPRPGAKFAHSLDMLAKHKVSELLWQPERE